MIDIIAELNDHLRENEIESHSFSLSFSNSGFVIELYENEEFGSIYRCFDSNDGSFDNDRISYNHAVIEQVKRNILRKLDSLVRVNHVLRKM